MANHNSAALAAWRSRIEELREPGAIEREMRRICELCKVPFERPDLSLKMGIARQPCGGRPWVWNGMRIPSGGGTSGWYVFPGEVWSDDADFYQPVHAVHLLERDATHPLAHELVIVPYLALPTGWAFLIAPDHEDVWFDEKYLKRPK